MGKYIAYALVVLAVLFFLEWFEIVDVPLIELPDLSAKQEHILEKSADNMRKRFGD